ncbi:MAG TPA: hypothetical protein PLX03_07380 [Candidatus Hydrogenedentes bacterium]|nr:hypothetical protein [Candidatus Hydrogenedentota bacterium]
MMNIIYFFRIRRLTRLADGLLPDPRLTPEESAYIAENRRLRTLLQQAFEEDTYPASVPEEQFLREWRQRQAQLRDAGKDRVLPPVRSSRYLWAAASLAAAALLVLFALVYLLSPGGQPVKAGPAIKHHPDMEQIDPKSGEATFSSDQGVPGRDL